MGIPLEPGTILQVFDFQLDDLAYIETSYSCRMLNNMSEEIARFPHASQNHLSIWLSNNPFEFKQFFTEDNHYFTLVIRADTPLESQRDEIENVLKQFNNNCFSEIFASYFMF